MITEVIDLERLLDQYDSGAVLIGPLLRLSLKSSYRYFYIAGKGRDVYEATLGLGVIKSEAAAQRQRADVIKKLESWFAEVMTFDGDVAMDQAVRARWSKEKIIAVWIPPPAATSEVAKATARQSIDGGRTIGLPGDYGEQPIDDGESADNDEYLDTISAFELPSVPDRAGPSMQVVLAAPTSVPLNALIAAPTQQLGGDTLGARQRHSRLGQAGTRSLSSTMLRFCAVGSVVASVAVSASLLLANRYKNLASAAVPVARSVPNQPAEATASALEVTVLPATMLPSRSQLSMTQDEAAATKALSPLQSRPEKIASTHDRAVPSSALSQPQSQPTRVASAQDRATATIAPPLQLQPAQIGSAQDRATATIAVPPRPQPPQISSAQDLARATIAQPAQIASVQTRGTATLALPPQVQPAQIAIVQDQTAPPPPTSKVASADAGSAPVFEPQAAPAQVSSPPERVDAEQVTMLINRGMEYLRSGDFSSARLLLKRAAEAGSPGAALMLGATFDPLFLPRLRANGIEPDVAQARRWYERALELGADGASQRLAEFGRIGK